MWQEVAFKEVTHLKQSRGRCSGQLTLRIPLPVVGRANQPRPDADGKAAEFGSQLESQSENASVGTV